MNSVFFLILRRLRAPIILLIVTYAVSVLGLVLIPGTDAAGQPWRMDFFHAFYFVSYMGSTIGFGELPHPFNGAQRLWTVFSIYGTVFAWLFAIGKLIGLVQDGAFQAALARLAFVRRVRGMRDPFYVVCGYGDTGRLLSRALAGTESRVVVIERLADRLQRLELEPLAVPVPALCADASDAASLTDAGVRHPLCRGVLALTGDDETNLRIALSTRLLAPHLKVIARAEHHETMANMQSFGTDVVINPFETFAEWLIIAFRAPGLYLLESWLASPAGTPLGEPVFPPQGRWILCGFGRFGKALFERLEESNEITVIEHDPASAGAPYGSVTGRGTEARTLKEAGIDDAVAVVAGTDHDVNNLSIIVTARELNPNLFLVARQNRADNGPIFEAANLDLVADNSRILTREIMSLITTPLTSEFLELAAARDRRWIDELVSRVSGVVGEHVPDTWVMRIATSRTPAVTEALRAGATVRIEHLCRSPHDRKRRLPCLALLRRRGADGELVPDEDEALQIGDRILFCGDRSARAAMTRIVTYPKTLHYLMTGRHLPDSLVWGWLQNLRRRPASNTG